VLRSGGAAKDIQTHVVTSHKLKDYIMYKYKERIKEKRLIILNVMIISSENRGCHSSAVPMHERRLMMG
jgi:hypothetical protein